MRNVSTRPDACLVRFLAVLGVAIMVSWGSMLLMDEEAAAQSQAAGTAQNAVGSLLIVRKDGIQETLRGKGSVPLYEFDVLKTEPGTSASSRNVGCHGRSKLQSKACLLYPSIRLGCFFLGRRRTLVRPCYFFTSSFAQSRAAW